MVGFLKASKRGGWPSSLESHSNKVTYIQLKRLGNFPMGYCAFPTLGEAPSEHVENSNPAPGGKGAPLILRQKKEGLRASFVQSPSMPLPFKTSDQMFSCWVQINISFCLYSIAENPHAALSSRGWALGVLLIVWSTRKSKRNRDGNMTEIQLN